jgi:rubredoxin
MPKKCPACNSTRYEKINNDHKCARCGFINKSKENLQEKLTNI